MTRWTVIGVWMGRRPVTTGVIPGRHDVDGGDLFAFDGLWARVVGAPDVVRAQERAIQEVLQAA